MLVLRNFKHSEFDSPDLKGSGQLMQDSTLIMIDNARDYAGIPFIVSSGFRTKERNDYLKSLGYSAKKTSSHLRGWAVDIKCSNSTSRDVILKALRKAGFTRIGIAKGFIHADNDPKKVQNLTWVY